MGMMTEATAEDKGAAKGYWPRVRPINWFDALPPLSVRPPDSPELGLLRWARLFEYDVNALMNARGISTNVPVWTITREYRACQEELLTAYMVDLFARLRDRILRFEPA